MTNFTCDTAHPLIPRYLDGELVEEQAGPLRRHLLACQACRTVTQGEKTLHRWFEFEPEVRVPQGFSARVARLAFAGAEASACSDPSTPRPTSSRPEILTAAKAPMRSSSDRILPFVLKLTAAAALLLLGLSGWIRSVHVPTGNQLHADELEQLPSLQELNEALERLDAEEVESSPEGLPVEGAGR